MAAACAALVAALLPLAAQAVSTPAAFVPPSLLAAAEAQPNAKFAVIVQGTDGETSSEVAATVRDQVADTPGKAKGLKRRFGLISGVSAELTGRQIEKLARRPWVAAITPDLPVTLADVPVPGPPPLNTVAPAVLGTPAAGSLLTADPGVWTSTAAPSYAYQWLACDAAGANCHDIPAATESVYTPTALDAGATVAVTVAATDANGSASATSAPVGPVAPGATPPPPAPPANTLPPAIVGVAVEGGTLTAGTGTWTSGGTLAFAFQWRACDAAGANCHDVASTAPAYAATALDVGSTLAVTVTATDANGSASVSSAPTAVVVATASPPPPPPPPPVVVAPTPLTAPVVSGTARDGDELTAGTGTWAGDPASFAYRWVRCGGPGPRGAALLADAPLGLWRLGDATGTVAADAGPNGFAGVAGAGVTFGAPGIDEGSTAVALDGADGAIRVPGVQSSSFANGFTLETWVKVASAQTNRGILGKWRWDSGGGPLLWIDESGNYTLVVTNLASNYLATTVAPVPGRWEHVVGTWDGTSLRLYRNGELIGSKPWTQPIGEGTHPFTIGDYDGAGHNVEGSIADAAAYDHALSLEQIQHHEEACAEVAGATSPAHAAGAADVGSTLRVTVTATNAAGSASADSAPTAPVAPASAPPPPPPPPAPPVSTAPPSVQGTAAAGATLTADPGTWAASGTPSFAYRWLACDAAGASCADIPDATGATYTATGADTGSTLAVVVTATDAAGSTSATSAPSAVVLPPAPVNASPPTISGTPEDGLELTASPGTWESLPPPALSYQWRACSGTSCTDVAGATAASYTPTAADVGSTLVVAVTATGTGRSTTVASEPTTPVQAAGPAVLAAPTVSGSAQEGQELTAAHGTWSGTAPVAYAYRWQRCTAAGNVCVDIDDATASTYVLARADVDHAVRVSVTASNAGGSLTASSDATAAVVALPNRQLWPYVTRLAETWANPGSPPAIAFIDSGIDASRPDFGGRVIDSVSLTSLTPNSPGDGRGHGTFAAGIAAGEAPGYRGANPAANLVSVDVMDDSGHATIADVIAGADWIYSHKVVDNIRVANLSLQSGAPTSFTWDPLDRAVEKLWLSGIVVVTAVGNYGIDGPQTGAPFSPGNDPFAISVGATDVAGTLTTADDFAAPWSASGYTPDGFAKPELTAPGRYIVGPVPPGSTLAAQFPERVVEPGYMQMSGTSFSAPMVSGAAAAILAVHPDWTPDQVKGALMLTAQPLPAAAPPMTVGVGALDAAAALTVTDAPNPNAALLPFLVPDPNGGDIPVFDAGAWGSAVQGNSAWAAGAWGSGAWGSGAWGSGAWGSGAWGSSYWSSGAWGSGVSAYQGVGSPTASAADADSARSTGYWLSPLDVAALGLNGP